MDEILSEHKTEFCLPDDVADELVRVCSESFRIQYELFLHFQAESLPVFGMTTKHHYFEHTCLQSRYRGRNSKKYK